MYLNLCPALYADNTHIILKIHTKSRALHIYNCTCRGKWRLGYKNVLLVMYVREHSSKELPQHRRENIKSPIVYWET